VLFTEESVVKRLRLLIIDDEAPARAKVRRLVSADPRYEIVGEAVDGLSGLQKIESLEPEVLVLDITMPKVGGFEMLAALPAPRTFEVIFATASDKHAILAFEQNALDYVLKPFDAERMQHALDRVWGRRGTTENPPGIDRFLSEQRSIASGYLTVRTEEGWVALPLAEVSRISAADKYVVISCAGAKHIVRGTLRTLHARLASARFLRVHRGDVVALSHVLSVESSSHGDAQILLRDGQSVSLSRTYRAAFFNRFLNRQ
jgi:two-component system LytT family response regulator